MNKNILYGLAGAIAGTLVGNELLNNWMYNGMFNGMFKSFAGSTTGKTINIPAGVHTFTTTLQSALTWGDNVTVNGAGRDSTILRAITPFAGAAATNSALVNVGSNVTISNLTLDGAYIVQNALTAFGPGSITLQNCRLMRGNKITSVFGQFVPSFIVRNCLYDFANNGNDQQATACKNSGLFENNTLDRRNGQGPGSSLTFGVGSNITIRNNTIIRTPAQSQGTAISLEPFQQPGYNNITMTGNNITNGNIKIGGGFTPISFQIPIKNVRVTGNTFNNGQIWLLGPQPGQTVGGQAIPIGLGANMMSNFVLQPNTFKNPAGKPPIVRQGMLKV